MSAPHEQSAHVALAHINKRQQHERDQQRSEHDRQRAALRRRHDEDDKTNWRNVRAYPEARMAVRAGEQAKLRLEQRKEYEALRDRHREEIGNASA